MSVGGGKEWRRWRNIGAIMGKNYKVAQELKDRFGAKATQKRQEERQMKTKVRPENKG